jgi:hypothetical protein
MTSACMPMYCSKYLVGCLDKPCISIEKGRCKVYLDNMRFHIGNKGTESVLNNLVHIMAQWLARPTPMREVRGSSPVRDKDFRARIRRPNYLGLVTLTSFGWDDKRRSSVCTHSEHQARTIKILQSLCVSHKIVETYRNQHAPEFSKGKMEYDAPMAALTSLISGCDTFWEQARTSAKRHEHSIVWICAL